MFARPRSSWLLVVLLGGACLAYTAVAQLTASPAGALARAPLDAVKASDTVNVTGEIILLANQPNVVVYTVPSGKRLIVTSLWATAWLNLVEISGGHETVKVPGTLQADLFVSTIDRSPQVLTFNYPLGIRFEPGSTVAYSTGGYLNPNDYSFEILLVGALVDA